MKMKAVLAALLWAGSRNSILAANIAEGQYAGGRRTYLLDEAVTTTNLVGKAGTDSDHIAVCGASDVPKGIITDQGAIGDDVAVELLGANDRTLLGVASGAITADDRIVPAASGKVKTLPASAGTYWIVGRAIKSADDAGEVMFVPCFPHQVTVT